MSLGERELHSWGERGHEYERRREKAVKDRESRDGREKQKSPDRRKRRQSYEDRDHSSDEEETEFERRQRLQDEYKRGYERARREIMRRSVSVMREIQPAAVEGKSVDFEAHRDEEKRRVDRERANALRRTDHDEVALDARDDDMVDDIVDILYSRKYGDEKTTHRDRPADDRDLRRRKRIDRQAKKAKKQAKKEKKERKRAKKDKKRHEAEELKIKLLKKIDEKLEDEQKKRKEVQIDGPVLITDDEAAKKVDTSDSSADSSSESEMPTDEEDDFYDLPSPAEDGEITDEKVEFSEENFKKMSKGINGPIYSIERGS